MSELHVEGLSIAVQLPDERKQLVHSVSFRLSPGKVIALVGESGSGKSVTARSLVGLSARGCDVSARQLTFAGEPLTSYSEKQWRALRGKQIGFVLQDALVSLDPLRTIGDEISEALQAHGWGNRQQRQQRVLELLEKVGIPHPELRARQRAGELSGGLRQRALIASALALDPPILIADEPTTALDTTVQAQIIALLQTIRQQGRGLLIISHDLNLVSQLADEVIVLHHGVVVEQGAVNQVLRHPQHEYTRQLLAAAPGARQLQHQRDFPPDQLPVMVARHLHKSYTRARHRIIAVDDVNFVLHRGETLGIIGESGSGKTTTARIVMGLVEPDSGEIDFAGLPWVNPQATKPVRESQRRARRRALSIIYQDPLGSFDPRWTVAQVLSDALDAIDLPRAQHPERIAALLEQVRLPVSLAQRRPQQLSGGQRQRIAIARALATEPEVILCDEPVSALDASVQAQILDLLSSLQQTLGVAYLFISHDLAVIRHLCDRVLVMQAGKVVEQGSVTALFNQPAHPFTRQLLAAAALHHVTHQPSGSEYEQADTF
ncbi:dipeptide ABC transporter ATP-binding protein [Pantoea sp. A4]|uniref:dipeptide ABC transporter ATP-binding protein n=1 Tax=Pantoea sp. A4 TaxID=1225184 RepID=UPI000381829D|nr:ABC transporter ATP-binding protein [Pantoea sp. A4]